MSLAGSHFPPSTLHYESESQSCLTLCHPMDFNPPGSIVHGIFQARILEWVAIPFSRGSSQPRDRPQVPFTAGSLYSLSHQGIRKCVCNFQSCSTLYDPMDCSLPASSVHGILQTRILEWIDIPFSRVSSWPRN